MAPWARGDSRLQLGHPLLPWESAIRNLFRRPLRTMLTFVGLSIDTYPLSEEEVKRLFTSDLDTETHHRNRSGIGPGPASRLLDDLHCPHRSGGVTPARQMPQLQAIAWVAGPTCVPHGSLRPRQGGACCRSPIGFVESALQSDRRSPKRDEVFYILRATPIHIVL